jgi:hypothetical protein
MSRNLRPHGPAAWPAWLPSALPSTVLAAVLASVLAACGPGVGGTGTGNSTDGLSTWGAAPSNVCLTADFSPLLSCGGAAAPGAGTAVVYAAEASPASRVLARFEGSRLTLDLRCLNRSFEGEWASAGQLGTRYFGSITTASGARSNASVIVAAQGGTFVMLVQDFNGQRIGEPLLLQRVASATTAAGC